jgi:hypothetical protein
MTATEEQIARLPRWARDEIYGLRNRVATLEATVAGDTSPEWIEIDPYGDRIGIPIHRSIRFHPDGQGETETGKRGGIDTYLRANASIYGGYALEVRAESQILVRPQSGNLVYVETVQR